MGPIRQAHFKPLFRACLHISLARSGQVSTSNVSGVGNTSSPVGGGRGSECLMSDNLPCSFIVSAFVLFLLIARPPEGVCLHMGVPSSSPPVLPPSLPVAPAATTPLWSRALWSRSPTPSHCQKSVMFSILILLSPLLSSIPPRKLLPPSRIPFSLGFHGSTGSWFYSSSRLPLLISLFSPPAQWWCFSGLI